MEATVKTTRDQNVDREKLMARYRAFLKLPVWAYSRDVKRIIRPYSTSDFEREYFIPDL